jgi:hypothetical protein
MLSKRARRDGKYANRSGLIFLILTLSLLLTVFAMSCAYCSESGENEIVFEYCPAGHTTTEPGYWSNIFSGRLILEGLRGLRLERDHWQLAYEDLSAKSLSFAEEQRRQWAEAENAIAEERAAWQGDLSRAKRPGFGAFIGVGYTTGKKVQGVAGIGFVFKF